ncbi:MAG: signal recognition particle protein [Rickettsiales bacterium]|nr:signal recognition particle protein [Rickettsiales bacterium]
MFNFLGDSINTVFDKLKNRGALTEQDINTAMREIRIALLEADVALPVAKSFIAKAKKRALGQDVIKSVTPGQMVVKIVQDTLEEMLGGETTELNLSMAPPAVVLMVGLQGSGKTTSTAKLALHTKNKLHKNVLMASLDIYRPAAQKQLQILGEQIGIETLEIIENQAPEKITKRALDYARKNGIDVVFLDTAGRLHVDESLMDELKAVKEIASPSETMLVADALTGQDAVNVADSFNKTIGITGITLTRIDGDSRGGAALSMKTVTGAPIKFLGAGEKTDDLEIFHPDRIASRILDMGDIVSLVEKASENIDVKESEKLAKKMKKGTFDFDDLANQLKQMNKLGGISSLMGMLPGVGKLKDQLADANIDNKIISRQIAIVSSMTKKERKNPKLINSSRKRRIANGSGTTIQDVNRLIKQHKQMSLMMKKMGKMDQKSLMRGDLGKLLPPNMKL